MGKLRLGVTTYALVYFVILELMLVAAVLFWPDFAENVDAIRLMAPIPALRDMLDQIEEGGAYAYIAGQHFFKGTNTMGTAAAVLFSVGAVAGEVHRGTLEILLARPYSRFRILTERWVLGALALTLPIFASSATIPWLSERVDETTELASWMLGSFHASCILLAIYSVTFFFSTIGSNPTRIAIFMLFIGTFQFALYMIKKVTHWSLYRLADIQDFMAIEQTGSLDWTVCASLLGVSALFFAASHWAFLRRVP